MVCCQECFDENEIIKFIIEENKLGDCDYCKKKSIKIISVEILGEFIDKGFFKAYDSVENFTGAMWDGENSCYIGPDGKSTGESIFEILYNTEQIFSENHTDKTAIELLEDLICESRYNLTDHKHESINYYEEITVPSYVVKNDLYGEEITFEYDSWQRFKNSCKYFNRYFDLSYTTSRESLLTSLKAIFSLMEGYIDCNLDLYRVREYKSSDYLFLDDAEYYSVLSPPPSKNSQNNRMSPAGISYMYLGSSIEACIKEVRLKENDTCIVGRFNPKRKIKILDLTKTPYLETISIFSEQYNHDTPWIKKFIESFILEISKPIHDNEKNIEYIATQVLSEYIRMLGYEGIKYTSSVYKQSYNIALFCGPDPELSEDFYRNTDYVDDELEYFTNWLKLKEVSFPTVFYELLLSHSVRKDIIL